MKKIFLIILASMFLANCSEENNQTENNINSIIGTWKQTDIIKNGVSEKNECTTKNTITFNEDKSLKWLNHNGNNCDLDGDGAYTGTWTKKSEGIYEFRTDEGFVIKKENNKIEIQEDNDSSRTWIFQK